MVRKNLQLQKRRSYRVALIGLFQWFEAYLGKFVRVFNFRLVNQMWRIYIRSIENYFLYSYLQFFVNGILMWLTLYLHSLFLQGGMIHKIVIAKCDCWEWNNWKWIIICIDEGWGWSMMPTSPNQWNYYDRQQGTYGKWTTPHDRTEAFGESNRLWDSILCDICQKIYLSFWIRKYIYSHLFEYFTFSITYKEMTFY